ncbi:MAG: tRNA (adenosine(37)-N6)-threonylcarbamoyltransferase complex ATPase subunit type 1 TsaE, partial [Bacteroidales bacterium]|nr:tRNA (adenosine(37)-N6)-threonylcarbamoyltransferase complex ATPase subunit type 1 TsaE [Bacteroidales bacterium]
MKQQITIANTADLDRAAAEFLEKIGDRTLVAFFAPMGAGKTTFTTAICKALGVTDPVGSPTFAIVNE